MEERKISEFNNLLKKKCVAMLAPSFIGEFEYPVIINQLKDLGFDKVVELTFGAKMVNREYHKKLKKSKKLLISSVCPGIVSIIKEKYPHLKNNLIKADSPMIAMAKICKDIYPKHKIVFISPCNYKKQEARGFIDYVIDYKELNELFKKFKIKKRKTKILFDKFYNDYTKIYPLSGGLTKTAHLKGILKKSESLTIDGIKKVMKFLDNPDKNIKFLDVTFCIGGCIGGPCTSSISLKEKKQKVLNYSEKAKDEDIPETRKGLIEKAKGIKFSS